MQWYSAVILMVLGATVYAEDFYPSKFDHINTHEIIDNVRLRNKYVSCITEEVVDRCPPDALELKKTLPDALKNTCARCSSEQQEKIKDTLEYLCQQDPEAFAKVTKVIDPKGEYRVKFEAKFGKLKNNC